MKFLPVANVGDIVVFYPHNVYARILAVEPLPGILIDFGAITAGSYVEYDSKSDKLKVLLMDDSFFAQYRIFPITSGIEIELWQPLSAKRWSTRHLQARVRRNDNEITDFERWWTEIYSPFTEFFVVEDRTDFKLVVYNISGGNLGESKVLFLGWKFKFEKTSATPGAKQIVVAQLPPGETQFITTKK